MTDYIIFQDRSNEIKGIGYLIRSDHGFSSGTGDNGEAIIAISRDATEDLILQGIKFKFARHS